MNNQKYKISVISLKSSDVRRAYVQSVLSSNKISFEFKDGVEGSTVNRKSYADHITSSEAGCAMSHYDLYSDLISENEESRIILEDDFSIDKDFEKFVNKEIHFPSGWDVILLGHHPTFTRYKDCQHSYWFSMDLFEKYKLRLPAEKCFGGYGYIISLKGAKKLVKNREFIQNPVDHFLSVDHKLNLYIVKPAIVKIDNNMSDNYHSMEEREAFFEEIREVKRKSLKHKIILILNSLSIYEPLKRLKHGLRNFYLCFRPLKRNLQ